MQYKDSLGKIPRQTFFSIYDRVIAVLKHFLIIEIQIHQPMGVPQSNFGRNCQLLHGIYLMILYEKKMSIKNQMAIYRLSLLFKVRAVYCILTKNRNVLFPSILNHFILAQGSFSGSSLLPNAIYLIIVSKNNHSENAIL